jgi:hypothetical protein
MVEKSWGNTWNDSNNFMACGGGIDPVVEMKFIVVIGIRT